MTLTDGEVVVRVTADSVFRDGGAQCPYCDSFMALANHGVDEVGESVAVWVRMVCPCMREFTATLTTICDDSHVDFRLVEEKHAPGYVRGAQ